MIKKVDSKYILFSRDGTKRLGEFKSKKDAIKRERQIQWFKFVKGKK